MPATHLRAAPPSAGARAANARRRPSAPPPRRHRQVAAAAAAAGGTYPPSATRLPGALPSEAARAEYEACRARLEAAGVDRAPAALERAFGWASQLYWRGERVDEPPTLARVDATFAYLESLGIDESCAAAMVGKWPELLTLGEERMAGNVGKLQEKFKMRGAVLAKSLQRKPRVLGATTDCEGNCAGDCTRCFAQF
jgi:hypothetical protein